MAAERLRPGGKATRPMRESILERLVAEAIRSGADSLEVEYRDGYENVVAAHGDVGHGLARFGSSSPEAITLKEELYRIAGRKYRMTVDQCEYELRGRVYDSFGEDAFRVQLRRV